MKNQNSHIIFGGVIAPKDHTKSSAQRHRFLTLVHKADVWFHSLITVGLAFVFVLELYTYTHTLTLFKKMKLSNLVLIFAAVTEARKVDVGSRWEKKQGLYVNLYLVSLLI